jgi:hypothetical protein
MTIPQSIDAIEFKLACFRNIAILVRHAANLLHDAKGFAEQVNADAWYASRIGECQERLKTELLPEVDATVKQLETELRS